MDALTFNMIWPVNYSPKAQVLKEHMCGAQIIITNRIPDDHSQGIHWLLRAADQGHEEAIHMLSECYGTRRGINDRNEYEVQTFLEMSTGERAARKAARELFACLSNGEEYITAAQLERKMREIYKIQKDRGRQTSSSANDYDGGDGDGLANTTPLNGNVHHISPSPYRFHRRNDSAFITEAHLVSAAINYSNGHMPAVSQALTLSDPPPDALDHVPCFHRLIFHPMTFFLLCYHRFINALAAFPESTISNLNFLFLLMLYAVISSDSGTMFFPLGVYYVTLLVMVVATFKMLKSKRDFIDFRMWSGLFLQYGDANVDANASERQYLRNNMKPYLYFFVAFFANLMLTPIIAEHHQWMPHSEITVVSFALVFVSMFAFMYGAGSCPDWLILISFGVNVLAKYPYEMDTVVTTGWRFLDLKVPTFPSFVIGNGIEFCLSCRALLYLLIPGLLAMLARRRSWHGTYEFVIPHCVTLSWLQICIISSQCATMFGLVRAALGLAGLLLFLPLFGIVTLMIPVFAAVEWLSLTDPTVRLVASVCTAAFALIGSCFMAANQRTERYVTMLQICVCVLATAFLTFPYMTSNFESAHSGSVGGVSMYDKLLHGGGGGGKVQHETNVMEPLTWNVYYKYCQQPAWERENRIQVQLRCSQLDGQPVKWEGTVANVEISRVSNYRADLVFNWLPMWWSELIACWYGERNRAQCGEREQCDEMRAFLAEQKRCNLNVWNTYEYDITVQMPSGGGLLGKSTTEMVVRGPHGFGNFTQRLNVSDRIWFRGRLQNTGTGGLRSGGGGGGGKSGGATTNDERIYMTLGKARPTVDLAAIGCVSCSAALESYQIVADDTFTVNDRIKDLYRGVKYLLNVLLNPLVTFK